MRAIQTLLVLLLLAAGTTGVAQNTPATTTFEVLMADFRMADSSLGTIGFRECDDDCDYQRLRLSANTQYFIDEKPHRFDEFLEAIRFFEKNGNGKLNLNVKRDDTSGTCASIFIYTR